MLKGKTTYTCNIITETFEFSRGVHHRLEYVTVSAKTLHVSMQNLAYFSNLKSNNCVANCSKECYNTLHIKLLLLLLLLLLARVTYNQVQPLRINCLATEFLPKLELYA